VKFDAESVAPGSRSRLNIGLIAAVPLIVLALLLPGPGVWLFMAPLLWGIRGAGWKDRGLYTAAWSGVLLVLSCYPLLRIDPASFLLALVLWALFYFLLGVLLIPWRYADTGHPLAQVLAPAVVWLGLSRVFTLHFPPGDFWLLPVGLAPWPGEVVSLVGSWGLQALTLTTSAALALLLTPFRKTALRTLAALAALIPIMIVAAPEPDTSDSDQLTISMLQGDFGIVWEERVALLDSVILPAYLEMYRDRAPESDLVLAPEYALPLALEDRPDIIEMIQTTVDSLGAPWLIGAEGRVPGETDLYFNTAWMFRPHQALVGRSAPYPAPYTLHDTVPGPGPAGFDDPVSIGVLLCFDLTIPHLCYDLGRSKELLVILSNLQGFDRTPIRRFLRGLAQLRAAETGRYLAVASNTGPTGIIDPMGRALGWAGPGRRTVSGTIRLTNRPSWYVLYGNTVVWIVWIVSLAFTAWNARSRQKEGVSNDEHANI